MTGDASLKTSRRPSRTRHGLRIAAWSIGGLIASLLVIVAIGGWVLGRESTLQRIVVEAEKALDGRLHVEGVTGSIYDRVAFDRLVFRSKTRVVTLDHGTLRYRLEPWERRFTIVEAHAAKLTIETIAKSDEPTGEPDTLELPRSLRLDTLKLDAVHLDAIEIVDGDRKTALADADLRGRYASDGGVTRWIIERIAVSTPWGRAAGDARLDATKPFAIDGRLTAAGQFDDVPYRAPMIVTGRLADLALASDFTVSDPTHAPLAGHAEARVRPFRDQPIEQATLHVAGIAPQRWKSTLPEADITIDAAITPMAAKPGDAGRDPFTGTLRAVNALPGPIDRGRIPLAALNATVRGDALAITASQLKADLGTAGRLSGTGNYVFANGGASSFKGTVEALDLHAIHGKAIASKFAGPIAVSQSDGVAHLDTQLADIGRSVRLRGELAGEQMRIANAEVVLGHSRVAAAGRVDLAGNRPFDLAGTLVHVDPHDFGDFAKADLNAGFKVSGTLGAAVAGRTGRTALDNAQEFEVTAAVRVDPSRVFGRPLAGTVAGTIAGAIVDAPAKGKSPLTIRQIEAAHVALAVGTDRFTADGDFGRPNDRLQWTVDAPRLADLELGLAGALKGDGSISGTLVEPAIDFTIAGDDLRYTKRDATPSTRTTANNAVVTGTVRTDAAATTLTAATTATTYRVDSLRGHGRLLAGAAGTLQAHVGVTGFSDGAVGPPIVQGAEIDLDGTRDAHRVTLSARSSRFDFTAAAQGGLDASNLWRGTVERLESRGRLPFVLTAPTTVLAGPDRVEVGPAHLQFTDGEVDLDRLIYVDQRIDTAGRASGFPLAIVGTFSRDFAARVSTSLKFGAAWDLRVGSTIDGKVRLFRESGNIRFLTEPRFDVDPDRLEVDAQIVADRITAKIAADGRGLGQIDASFESRLSQRDGRWGIAGDAPLLLKSDIDLPDLRWLARLSGVPGLDVYGSLKVAMTGQGTIGKPSLSGHVSGDAVGLRWPDQGLNARDGHLELDFEGDRLVLKQATLAAGSGHLDASGNLRLADSSVSGTLAVKFDKFEAVSRTDRTMVVSGTGALKFGPSGVDVTADVKADRGSLQLAERQGPVLSTDIVIVGRETDDLEAPPRGIPVRFEVKFDMGDDFKVKGAGFDGKLGGNIRISGIGTDLRAIGTVQVREGTYEGYGQRLTIDHGNLIFSGPIDNPALDISALRKNLAVEAGVQITGTALAPIARLTSTPDVPDTEKLSWLVLGHGLAASNKSDYALLTSAAAGLLGSSDSASIQSRIAATLGVDEIGVSGIGGTNGGLLTVGKQISSRLRVTFEQGFTKAATLIKARYNIYKRIDLQVQTGTESAIDLFYTFTFD
jgi:translocation and assembly module TamB